jgi:hypothetical protein
LGTSNWQQIPFCIDALMKIEPRRVLDVGVGFGRWGMIVREFCDVWFSRVFKDQWQVHLEGIEAFPKSITEYHRHFYNQIHLGDASEVIPTLEGPWSVTIYGDVLEHFTKARAHELLNLSLDRSDYVIVNIPIGEEHPQGEAYGNVYERHLSSWEPEDFVGFGLVRQALLQDYIGREYGSFILSRKDPRNLRAGLFSQGAVYAGTPAGGGDRELAQVSRRVQEKVFEVEFIKRSASYRLAQRIKGNPLVRRIVDWKLGDRNLLTVRPLPLEGGQGAEAWVLGVHARADEPAMPWDAVTTTAPFVAMASAASAHGSCRMHSGLGGELVVRTTEDPAVRFMAHVGSTRAAVTFNGRTEVVDLRSPHPVDVIVYPGRTPMVQPRTTGVGGVVIEASPRERTRSVTAEALKSEAVGAA